MKITSEVLKAMDCELLTAQETKAAELELLKHRAGGFVPWHYTEADEVWKLHLGGYVFYIRRRNLGKEVWFFGLSDSLSLRGQCGRDDFVRIRGWLHGWL